MLIIFHILLIMTYQIHQKLMYTELVELVELKSKGTAFSIFTNNDKGKIADSQKTAGKSVTCCSGAPDAMAGAPLGNDDCERAAGSSRSGARRGGARSSSYSSRGGNTGS